MDEIPEDVRKAAERLVVDSANRGGPLVTALIEPIARAILAERARCAKVADGFPDTINHPMGPAYGAGFSAAVQQLRIAIRTPAK